MKICKGTPPHTPPPTPEKSSLSVPPPDYNYEIFASIQVVWSSEHIMYAKRTYFFYLEENRFSYECLRHYAGDTIVHVGELYGETFSSNPWGQSTSRIFQLELGKTFRCVFRTRLPSWPGYMDSLSIWCRCDTAVDCDGGSFCYIPNFETVNDSE